MKVALGIVVLTVALASSALAAPESLPTDAKKATGAVPQQWIVVMDDPRSARRRSRLGGVGYAAVATYAADPRLRRESRRLAGDYQLTIVDEWPIVSLKVHCVVATLPASADMAALVASLQEDDRVVSVQKMNTFASLSDPDPYRGLQPGVQQMDIDQAHRYATGAGVDISIIDSGVDAQHPDLDGAIVMQENFVNNEAIPAEQHGTGIAGVIGAQSNNGVGVTGIAPNARIQALRACWQDVANSSKAHCNTLTLSRALDRVVELQPRVLNLSLSGPRDALLERLLSKVLANGTIVVSAFDENRDITQRFPPAQAGVLFGRGGQHYSADDPSDCLPAPGTDVLTIQPRGGYDVMQGNSLSAAHLSGTLALILERYPELAVEQLSDALHQSIVPRPGGASISACRAFMAIDSKVRCPTLGES